MKILLLLLLLSVNSYAGQGVNIQDANGNLMGTAANPIHVSGGGSPTVLNCTVTTTSNTICSGSATTTTGTISSGTNTVVVASATGWAVNMGIAIKGAGAAGAGTELISKVTAINGTTFTLADNATGNASSQLVSHDDTVAIQAAFNSGFPHIYFPSGSYNVTSSISLNAAMDVGGDGALAIPNASNGGGTGTSPNSAGTLFVNRTTGIYNFVVGASSIRLHDFSIVQAAGITMGTSNPYAITITGGTTVAIENDSLMNISTFGMGTSLYLLNYSKPVDGVFISHCYFVAGNTSDPVVLIGANSPAGDFHFDQVNIESNPSSYGSGIGMEITNSDVNLFEEVKINGFSQDVNIDPWSGATVANQMFTNCSFEGAGGGGSTPIFYLNPASGATVANILIANSEFGVIASGAYAIDLEGSGTSAIEIDSNLFQDTGNGIKVNNSSGHVSMIGNFFNSITTNAVFIGSGTSNIVLIGDINSGAISNTGNVPITNLGSTSSYLAGASTHSGQASCWTTNGQAGYCTGVVGAGGACSCTGI